MELIIAILLYLGVVTSADQVNDTVIQDNQTQIEQAMGDGVVVGDLWEE